MFKLVSIDTAPRTTTIFAPKVRIALGDHGCDHDGNHFLGHWCASPAEFEELKAAIHREIDALEWPELPEVPGNGQG